MVDFLPENNDSIPSRIQQALMPDGFFEEEKNTVATYLQTHQTSFEESAFNNVDSLILSSLAYLNFEHYPLSDLNTLTEEPIVDILRFTNYKELTSKSWLKEGDDVAEFIEAFARSVRYRDLRVSFYRNENSENIDKQFSAVTFTAKGMTPYIAFRGTDGSLKGWKEDFDLSYKDVIPSHASALQYLSGVLSSLPLETVVNIGGHSKGGNLAEFAAANIDETGFARIKTIFNHDGPSFLNDPSERYVSEEFRNKRLKTVPESSLFGMVLEEKTDYHVIKSSASTVFQHRPLTWEVVGTDFVYADEITDTAQFFDQTLDAWLRGSTLEQREMFLGTIFNLVESTNAKSWEEFQDNALRNIPHMVREGWQLDTETKEMIGYTFGRLGGILRETGPSYLAKRLSKMFNQTNDEESKDPKEQ